MTQAITALYGSTLGLLALMIVHTWRDHGHLRTARWLLLFLVCMAAYIALQLLPAAVPGPMMVLALLATALPAAFWLFCLALFRDRVGFGSAHWGLIAAYIVLSMAGYTLGAARTPPSVWVGYATFQLPQLLKLLILAATLFVIAADWRTDLVEPRRRLRLVLLVVVGVYCIGVVSAELVLDRRAPPQWLLLMHSAVAALLTLVAALWVIRLPADELAITLGEVAATPQPDARGASVEVARISPADRARLDALLRSMSEAHTYRENGLSIGQLAQRLGIQEHRLRQLINRELGYRNFTEFLNRYRLDEASQRLHDPAQAHLPILSIALDCGYASLPPFNRAFKIRFGMTPSQFRQQAGTT